MGIKFDAGVYGAVEFHGPYRLTELLPPRCSGVYVVMVEDRGWGPYRLRPVYVGESGDLSQRGFPYDHHAWLRWFFAAGCDMNRVWIAVCRAGVFGRMLLEDALRGRYQPECNHEPLPAFQPVFRGLAGTSTEALAAVLFSR